MLKFFIILAAWITPGILLFLYLLWISKRRESPRGKSQAPVNQPVGSPNAQVNPWELELVQSVAAKPHKERKEETELDGVRVSGSRR